MTGKPTIALPGCATRVKLLHQTVVSGLFGFAEKPPANMGRSLNLTIIYLLFGAVSARPHRHLLQLVNLRSDQPLFGSSLGSDILRSLGCGPTICEFPDVTGAHIDLSPDPSFNACSTLPIVPAKVLALLPLEVVFISKRLSNQKMGLPRSRAELF